MNDKPVIPRELALLDVEDAIDYYLEKASEAIALGFVNELEHAYTRIGNWPEIGSLRYAIELQIPGLRFFPLNRYPFLVFYLVQNTHVEVWRILHERRDIPEFLRTEVPD